MFKTQKKSGSLKAESIIRAASTRVRFCLSAILFCSGVQGVDVWCSIPSSLNVVAHGEAFLRDVAERLNKLDQDSDTDIKVFDVNASKIQNHDVVAELFGVSLKSYKDIGDFTKGIELESLTMGVPLIEGTGFTIEIVTVEYEWNPPQCDLCKIFGHVQDHSLKKKKKKGKSKSTNGSQFGGYPAKQNIRDEPKATTNAPKNGTTNMGNASKSSTVLKNTVTSNMNDNIPVSNSYSALDEES
nr:hypothetical protein [Tanacetum cinerariifolium]